MAFTVTDFHDLMNLLEQQPEWRYQLRNVLLPDDLLATPTRIEEIRAILAEIAQTQAITATRMDQLTVRMDQLTVRMDQLTERVDRLGDRVDQLVSVMEAMERRIARIEGRLSVADGFLQEHKYRTHPGAFFGKIIRKARVVPIEDIYDVLEATLTDDEYDEVLPVDMIVKGRLRELPGQDVYLAVEVSVVVDKEDVRRADRRAELLRKAGLTAMPVVAGEDLTDGGERQAQAWKIPVLQNGRVLLWGDALTLWAQRLAN
jgi:DNA-binding transcriptional MerR regulator